MPPVITRSTEVVSSMRANESRSLVTTVQRQPCSLAREVAEARQSSASHPSCRTTANPAASSSSGAAAICSARSAVFSTRPALYSG